MHTAARHTSRHAPNPGVAFSGVTPPTHITNAQPYVLGSRTLRASWGVIEYELTLAVTSRRAASTTARHSTPGTSARQSEPGLRARYSLL
jgi:hypothetical protein